MKDFKYIKRLHCTGSFWKYFLPYLEKGVKLTNEELPYALNDTNFEYIKKRLSKEKLLKLVKNNPELLERLI